MCCVDVYWSRGVSSRQKGGGGIRDGHDYSNTLSRVNLYFLMAENDGRGAWCKQMHICDLQEFEYPSTAQNCPTLWHSLFFPGHGEVSISVINVEPWGTVKPIILLFWLFVRTFEAQEQCHYSIRHRSL